MNQRYDKLKSVTLAALTMGLGIVANADPTITGVTAQQRYPWNGKVDIAYTVSGLTAAAEADGLTPHIMVLAINRATTPWTTNIANASCLFVGPYATEALVDAAATSDGAHRIVWDMNAQGLDFMSTNVVFAVLGDGGVQLWEKGPYWATCNVGACKPEESGYYFWWGDKVGYRRNSANDGWEAVNGSSAEFAFSMTNATIASYNKSVNALTTAGYVDGTTNLVATHDAATVHFGATWRLPTEAEVQALRDNCETTWVENWNGTGVNGRLITGKGDYASKSIFLPAAGYGRGSYLDGADSAGGYWCSAPSSDYLSRAWGFSLESGVFGQNIFYRNYGQSVRPVRGFSK